MAFLPLKDDNPIVYIRFQYVTLSIMLTCVLVFAAQLTMTSEVGTTFVFNYGAIPLAFFGQEGIARDSWLPLWLTPVSYAFVHSDVFHLGGNLLFLWVFGDNIEDELGHVRFMLFYVFCGAV